MHENLKLMQFKYKNSYLLDKLWATCVSMYVHIVICKYTNTSSEIHIIA